jgi:hypothetical protein
MPGSRLLRVVRGTVASAVGQGMCRRFITTGLLKCCKYTLFELLRGLSNKDTSDQGAFKSRCGSWRRPTTSAILTRKLSSREFATRRYPAFAAVIMAPPVEVTTQSERAEDMTVAVLDVDKRLEVKIALRDRLAASSRARSQRARVHPVAMPE